MENVYLAKVVKIGNSKGVILPMPLMRVLNLERGDTLTFAVFKEGQFVARRLSPAELQFIKPAQILID